MIIRTNPFHCESSYILSLQRVITPWYVKPMGFHHSAVYFLPPPSASFLTPCVAQSLSQFSSRVQPFHFKSGGAKSFQKLRHQKLFQCSFRKSLFAKKKRCLGLWLQSCFCVFVCKNYSEIQWFPEWLCPLVYFLEKGERQMDTQALNGGGRQQQLTLGHVRQCGRQLILTGAFLYLHWLRSTYHWR